MPTRPAWPSTERAVEAGAASPQGKGWAAPRLQEDGLLGPDLRASPCSGGTGPPWWGGEGGTHKQQQTLVLPDGPTAAQEAEQEQQAPHRQEDVDARDEQGVGGHDLSEAGGIHHDPDADAQQAGPTQLLAGQSGRRGRNRRTELVCCRSRCPSTALVTAPRLPACSDLV